MAPSIRAASAVVDPPPQPYGESASMLSFYRNLVEPFGCTVDEQLLKSGPNVCHRDLADQLAGHQQMRGHAPDLIIVAHALPDLHPFTAVASHLNMLFGGKATSFSIGEQGLAAPFTALRIVDAFQRSKRATQALVAILEQTTIPTPFPLIEPERLVDSGVFMVLDSGTGLRVDSVESADSAAAVTRRMSELAQADPDGTLLVLGPWMEAAEIGPGPTVLRVAPGKYCTSVWLELAASWQVWQQQYSTVVLCDTEPRTRRSHLAVLGSGRSR
jgi:hypothetical protein